MNRPFKWDFITLTTNRIFYVCRRKPQPRRKWHATIKKTFFAGSLGHEKNLVRFHSLIVVNGPGGHGDHVVRPGGPVPAVEPAEPVHRN